MKVRFFALWCTRSIRKAWLTHFCLGICAVPA